MQCIGAVGKLLACAGCVNLRYHLATQVTLRLRGRLLHSGVLDAPVLVSAYRLGVVVQLLRQRCPQRPPSQWGRAWVHLKALLVLQACALILSFALGGPLADLPDWVEQLLSG